MPNQESVLWYCPDPVLFSSARKAFAVQGVRVRPVSPEQTGETVWHLFGLKGFAAREDGAAVPAAPAEPALVLSGFSRQRLDALLAALKRSGVPFIAHKAMLTPTNVSWTFAQLCEELSREHRAVTGGAGSAHSGQ